MVALVSGFRSMKRLGVFLLPPGWDTSPSEGYPQHFAGTHLYTWVERGTVREKCLAQEHNTISPARTRTRTTRFGVEHSNHEAKKKRQKKRRTRRSKQVSQGFNNHFGSIGPRFASEIDSQRHKRYTLSQVPLVFYL